MALRRIILLTGDSEGPFLEAILRAHDDNLVVDVANTPEALYRACEGDLTGCRLVSFCSSVIVPGPILARLPGPAYNFHPGPPEYPGRYPSIFALYDGAQRFGITVHEMAAKVDAGPIISAEWFAIPPDCDLPQLDEIAYIALAEKFRALSFHLATIARAMTRMPYRWSGRKTTQADALALQRITPDMDAAEIARRKRACGGSIIEDL